MKFFFGFIKQYVHIFWAKHCTTLCRMQQRGGMHEKQSINQACCVLAHFLNTIWKSAAEAMHRKKYIRQQQQAGGKKSFVSIRFSLCFWSLMTPELQGAIINHPCVFLVLPGHPVPFIRGTTSRLGTHRASHHL